MQTGTKVAIGLGALAGVGAFVFWPKDAKASSSNATNTDADLLKAISDAAAKGCADGAADKKAGRPSKVDSTTGFETPSTAEQAYNKAYADCYKLGAIADTGGVGTGGGGSMGGGGSTFKPTITFVPENTKDPVRAHSLAISIGNSKAVGVGKEDIDPDTGTYKDLLAFSKYGPNAAGLMALQDASGITPDGKYGLQTQRAFDYWYNHVPKVTSGTETGSKGKAGTFEGGT